MPVSDGLQLTASGGREAIEADEVGGRVANARASAFTQPRQGIGLLQEVRSGALTLRGGEQPVDGVEVEMDEQLLVGPARDARVYQLVDHPDLGNIL